MHVAIINAGFSLTFTIKLVYFIVWFMFGLLILCPLICFAFQRNITLFSTYSRKLFFNPLMPEFFFEKIKLFI